MRMECRVSLPGKTLLVVSDPTLIPTVLGSASGTGLPKSFICDQVGCSCNEMPKPFCKACNDEADELQLVPSCMSF
jgi:hypothetical protein